MMREIDDTIHQKTRLSIMAHLAAVGESDFLTIRKDLGLTDGNLSIHASILEKKGYIKTDKSFVDRKTRTVYMITAEGRNAFKEYLSELESVLKGGG